MHHRQSIRLKGYDYAQEGLYFITICTFDKQCLFGGIVDGEMQMNDVGEKANQCWLEIPKHFPNAVLHDCVVMPNHIHGIIEIVGPKYCSSKNATDVGANHYSPENNNDIEFVANHHSPENNDQTEFATNFDSQTEFNAANYLPNQYNSNDDSQNQCWANDNLEMECNSNDNLLMEFRANDDSPLRNRPCGTSKTIGSMVRGFKIGVTKYVGHSIWQRNYYEHIIRDYQSYLRISDYIQNNPLNWDKDKLKKIN